MDRASYATLIVESLEAVGATGEDPAPRVYARLFSDSPELEPLFIMGPSAKGHMLDEVFGVILDFVESGRYGAAFLRSEKVNHENLGVVPDVFMRFFDTLAATLREMLGEAWTPAVEQAWAALLRDLRLEAT